jgi:hypothetical protein
MEEVKEAIEELRRELDHMLIMKYMTDSVKYTVDEEYLYIGILGEPLQGDLDNLVCEVIGSVNGSGKIYIKVYPEFLDMDKQLLLDKAPFAEREDFDDYYSIELNDPANLVSLFRRFII